LALVILQSILRVVLWVAGGHKLQPTKNPNNAYTLAEGDEVGSTFSKKLSALRAARYSRAGFLRFR
jgi:hypothetical protein